MTNGLTAAGIADGPNATYYQNTGAEYAFRAITDPDFVAPDQQNTIGRVGSLVKKVNLKSDPEAQALEDVACLVFLETQYSEFSRRHEDAKVVSILQKTWKKMSPRGREAALQLELPPDRQRLISKALAPAAH